MKNKELVFLKLGGSLITEKEKPSTAKPEIIERIVIEIAQGLQENPKLQIILGHGSGSFGHASASKYQTHKGEQNPDFWVGFSKVWQSARQLNNIIIDELSRNNLPVIAFPPSSGVIAHDRKLIQWDCEPIRLALSNGLIPVVQGDVIFDTALGGAILSTEHIFKFLAREFSPQSILLAGSDEGVFLDPDHPQEIIPRITPSNFPDILPSLSGSRAADVTGGMASKVKLMLSILEFTPSTRIQIFSGSIHGNVKRALNGEVLGTKISTKQ